MPSLCVHFGTKAKQAKHEALSAMVHGLVGGLLAGTVPFVFRISRVTLEAHNIHPSVYSGGIIYRAPLVGS